MNPPAKTPRLPVFLSGLSLISCCFPIGIIGAVLGYAALRAAKASGQSTLGPIAAIAMGALSLVDAIGIYGWMKHDFAQRDAQSDQALERAEKGRSAELLDTTAACALAEAYLVKHKATSQVKVECGGPLVAGGGRAELDTVKVTERVTVHTYNVCFARKNRWLVLGAMPAGKCPDSLVDPDAIDAGQDAFEEGLRAANADALDRVALELYEARLAQVRHALETEGAAKCANLAQETVPVLDAERLGKAPDEAWGFLSSPVFNGRPLETKLADRAKSATEAREALSNHLIVVVSKRRVLPKKLKGDSWAKGFFEGTVALVDLDAGKGLCEGAISFESSPTIVTRGGLGVGLKVGPKLDVGGGFSESDLVDDLERHYQDELQTQLNALTGGRVSHDLK